MKTALKIFGLLCIVTLFVACNQNKAPTPYKITGEFVSMIPEETEEVAAVEDTSSDEVDASVLDSETPVEEEIDVPIDLTQTTLSIFYETTDEDGESEIVHLHEGTFDGKFEYEDEILEPTEITISLQISADSDPMEINTVIGTGHDIHFKLLDHPNPRPDQLILGGTSIQATSVEKFTISGDLSEFGDDFDNNESVVNLSASIIDSNGDSQTLRWGPVLVQDNLFHIEGEVTEPVLATLSISNSMISPSTQVVLEPQGNIVVSKMGDQTRELSTSSDEGYHAMLIASWQNNENYVELVDAWTSSYELAMNPPEPEETDDEADVAGDESAAEEEKDTEISDVNEDSESESDEDTASEDEAMESVASVEPADGCEDAEVGKYAEPVPSMSDTSGLPEWYNLRMQSIELRNATLREIVEGNDDPIAQHIAMRMNPYSEDSDALTAWNKLSEQFDEDYVSIHITPRIERIEKRVMLSENDAKLVPGQKAPAFTLLDLEGEEVSIYKVLGENDMVLIDFWASWCGPCIADFPELKKLYAAYTDEKFEIVGVSIDSTEEEWIGGVEDNELPWVQLGELEGWYGPIGTKYGVGWIPKGYLVDSKGCIYEKDIRPAALKEFLVNRYGMDESLAEPDPESEDTPGVSG